jgi:hypothetical protein
MPRLPEVDVEINKARQYPLFAYINMSSISRIRVLMDSRTEVNYMPIFDEYICEIVKPLRWID